MSEEKLPPDFDKLVTGFKNKTELIGLRREVSLPIDSSLPFDPPSLLKSTLNFEPIASLSCPVCGAVPARQKIVAMIVMSLLTEGSFSVGSVKSFWKWFGNDLCNHCKSKLNSIDEKKQQALKLLEEAVSLDNSNSSAKENLSALKRLS